MFITKESCVFTALGIFTLYTTIFFKSFADNKLLVQLLNPEVCMMYLHLSNPAAKVRYL